MTPPLPPALRCLALSLLLPLAACGRGGSGDDDAADRVVRTDSGGVEVVENHTGDRPFPWTPEPLATIGDVEGPAAFGAVYGSGVAVSPSGEIHVLDPQAHTIHVFTADGRTVRRFGRRGGGPGEFQFASGLAVEPDGASAVFAYDKMGLVRFDPAGRPLAERRLAHRPAGAFRWVGGRLTYVAHAEGDGGKEVLVWVSDTGADTLAATASAPQAMVEVPGCAVFMQLRPLLSPGVVWGSGGEFIAAAAGTAYAVDVWRDGRMVRRVRRAFPALAGTAELAVAEFPDTIQILAGPQTCRIGPKDMVQAQGYAPVASRVVAVAVAPDGGLWVRRRNADGTRAVDLFAPGGAYRGTLAAGAPWPVAFLDAERLIALEKDELEVPRLVVYRAPQLDWAGERIEKPRCGARPAAGVCGGARGAGGKTRRPFAGASRPAQETGSRTAGLRSGPPAPGRAEPRRTPSVVSPVIRRYTTSHAIRS